MNTSIENLQQAVAAAGIDGWLMYDFRGVNPLARSILGLSEKSVGSRRWLYFIPAQGEPQRIVHGIETDMLEALPGQQRIYRSWRELHQLLQETLNGLQSVAMEYAPNANNPYVSRVDAGTVELVRSFGPEVVSSGDLIQQFEAKLTPEQWDSHLAADKVTTGAFEMAWEFILKSIQSSETVPEQAVSDQIMQYFTDHDMTTYSPPIVARQPQNRLPHYETGTGPDTDIRQGDLVMIDLWCKQKTAGAIYSDLTRIGYLGQDVPADYKQAFAVVVQARDTGIDLVRNRMAAGESLAGWEVDQAVRQVIQSAGYGEAFLHRTGHSLGQEVHGNGAHLDDFEMREDRLLIPGSLFTIEPGIYLESFGLRTEVDVFIDWDRQVHVTGGPIQQEILRLV